MCNQTKQYASENVNESSVSKTIGNTKNYDATPDQIKMIAYDSSQTRARGLDTDKENV